MRRTLCAAAALVLAGLALIGGASSPAAACSAPQRPPTDQELLDRADVVFEGVYLSRRDPSAGAPLVSSADPIFFTFAADRAIKGSIGAQAVVSSARDGASCGADFTAGVRYRVYARSVAGSLTTDSVSGNRPAPAVATTTTAPPAQPRNAPPASPRSGAVRLTG